MPMCVCVCVYLPVAHAVIHMCVCVYLPVAHAVIQVAQPAADELLNTLEYRTRKTVGRFTSKIRELAEEREE